MAWKERSIAIPVESDGLVLEGVWQAGTERGAVIAPAHPLYGGSLDHPVVNEVAYALYRAGFASVRFNWRGVGASQGVPSGDQGDAERDFGAALEHLAQTLSVPLMAAGYSFGAVTALRVGLADDRVRDLLLVSPPVEMIRDLPAERLEGQLHVIVGGQDSFAPPDQLSSLLRPLPNARLDVIPEADHFFATGGLVELSELVRTARE
jgi:alpha/beta superfamily hydrolase